MKHGFLGVEALILEDREYFCFDEAGSNMKMSQSPFVVVVTWFRTPTLGTCSLLQGDFARPHVQKTRGFEEHARINNTMLYHVYILRDNA